MRIVYMGAIYMRALHTRTHTQTNNTYYLICQLSARERARAHACPPPTPASVTRKTDRVRGDRALFIYILVETNGGPFGVHALDS